MCQISRTFEDYVAFQPVHWNNRHLLQERREAVIYVHSRSDTWPESVREDVFMAGKRIRSMRRTSYPAGRQLLRGQHCSIV